MVGFQKQEDVMAKIKIAQMIGYEHNSSFTRVFKEFEHISPAEFRKRL